jgi:cytochrome c biogenesis protein CcdA
MDIWAVLLPILLTDVVNPVLFAFLVYAASSNRPVLLSSSMLLGHTVAYFSAGVGLALFMEKITDYLATPHTIDFIIELILGAVLVWLAFKARKNPGKQPDENAPQLTVFSAFSFGAVVNFVGIPFAVPYFAAIDQVLKTDFTALQVVTVLLGYNLIYAIPFAIVPALSAIMGKEARPLLDRINARLERASAIVMPLLLGLVGLALLLDAASYFISGTSLF